LITSVISLPFTTPLYKRAPAFLRAQAGHLLSTKFGPQYKMEDGKEPSRSIKELK